MECSKKNQYFLIETLRRNEFNATQIHTILYTAWPDECLSVQQIRKLSQQFGQGDRDSFERKQGSGRPKSDIRVDSVAAVTRLVREDSSITVRQISAELQLSHSMVHGILTDDIELIWFHTKWVPHTLTERNKAIRVERCEDLLDSYASRLTMSNLVTIDEKFFYCRKLQPRHVIGNWVTAGGDEKVRQTARRSNMEKKFLAIVAVSQRGEHYHEVLPRNESIDSNRYIEFLINLEAFLRNLPNPILPENMRLQHDNARPHTSRATTAHIEARNIRLLRQPPYSPDLNLCDRYIFPRLEALRDDFDSLADVNEFLTRDLPYFTHNRMKIALQENVKHIRTVIDNDGNYV
jgi:hypothetical protein